MVLLKKAKTTDGFDLVANNKMESEIADSLGRAAGNRIIKRRCNLELEFRVPSSVPRKKIHLMKTIA